MTLFSKVSLTSNAIFKTVIQKETVLASAALLGQKVRARHSVGRPALGGAQGVSRTLCRNMEAVNAETLQEPAQTEAGPAEPTQDAPPKRRGSLALFRQAGEQVKRAGKVVKAMQQVAQPVVEEPPP